MSSICINGVLSSLNGYSADSVRLPQISLLNGKKVTNKNTAESALIDTQKSGRTEQKCNKFTIAQLISLLVKKISDIIFHIDTNDAPYNSCSVIC